MKPDPKCPSCGGTGWAVIIDPSGRWGAFASGPCRCVGGLNWAKNNSGK